MIAIHLDLGSGSNPRNPFNAKKIVAIDIRHKKNFNRKITIKKNITFVNANLALERIPFPDNYFTSVSAYDFLEHIPRLIVVKNKTTFPFITLMSEIYRVLKPDGQFYAITPYFPKESAFVDPTHVNFISKDTYKYFVKPFVFASIYGFAGAFDLIKVKKINFDLTVRKRNLFRFLLIYFICFIRPGSHDHILWHFRASKSD